MEPLIITVAGVGAELQPADQPNLPITPDQLAEDAASCRVAGASIYHLHVRDDEGRPTMDVEHFGAARAAIEDACDVIVQFTSGGAVGDPDEVRLAPLALGPEMASLTTGSVNFGQGVFWNPMPLVTRLYQEMRAHGVLPEFEIFEPGMIANAERLCAEQAADHHLHYDFVLGVPGGMPAWGDSVDFLRAHLPDGATWTATGIGRAHLEVAAAAIEAGGHVRTGFEDVRYFSPGRLATSNAELIARVAEMARLTGRAVATPEQARTILGLAP